MDLTIVLCIAILIVLGIILALFLLRTKENCDANKPLHELEVTQEVAVQTLANLNARLDALTSTINQNLNTQLTTMRQENQANFKQMKSVVDEDLQKQLRISITNSFEHLTQELQGMHSLAQDVGRISTLLSGAKTRGVVGEVQLKAIVREMLPNTFIGENVHPVPSDPSLVVELGIALPTKSEEKCWLPVDSKFPRETYERLEDARQHANKAGVEAAQKEFARQLNTFATQIEKYINPPATTNFAIMFLPSEGIYAEANNIAGLTSGIYQKHHVLLASPSTLATMLNTVLLSYQNMYMQEYTSNALKVIETFKGELNRYTQAQSKLLTNMRTGVKYLEETVSVRIPKLQNALNNALATEDEIEIPSLNIDQDTDA